MQTIRIAGLGHSFSAEPGETLLRAALCAGVAWPYECSTGACGTCKFELLGGELEVLRDGAPGLSERDRRKNRYLACQCRASAPCEVKVHIEHGATVLRPPQRQSVRLQRHQDITHDIREFVFAGSRPADFLPGQYALLQIPGTPEVVRAYSMSNLPNQDGQWHFQVRKVPEGRGTTALFALAAGTEVTLDGPYGHAWLREDVDRDIVCIAGGSGLAPMLSIARAKAASPRLERRRLHFFYGGRSARDICGEDMLRELPEFGRTLTYHPVVSDASDRSWKGETGFVHEAVGRKLGAPLAQYEYYLAGPPPMATAVLDLLQVLHAVPVTQIHFDRFF